MELTRRRANTSGALICGLLLGYAYYAQYVQGFEPCPLCILQRVAMLGLGVVFLIAALHDVGRAGAQIYAVLLTMIALTGIGLTLRHIYIQSLPEGSVAACGAPLETMLEMFPVMDVLRKVLTGSGECATSSWKFLGLTMPMWLLGWFVVLGAVGFWFNWRTVGGRHTGTCSI